MQVWRSCPLGLPLAAQVLGREGTPPAECTPEIMREIVKQHLDAPSMWAIFPLQVCPPQHVIFHLAESAVSSLLPMLGGRGLAGVRACWRAPSHIGSVASNPIASNPKPLAGW